jgi:hypothetical protein
VTTSYARRTSDRRNCWSIWLLPLVAPLLNGFCGDWVSGSATILFSDSCYAQLEQVLMPAKSEGRPDTIRTDVSTCPSVRLVQGSSFWIFLKL